MLVSLNWLTDYVSTSVPVEELTTRLMMAGLNHESTEPHDDDFCIDLEVTSNRPDCLGHVGIAREIAVLFGTPLKLPAAQPPESTTPVTDLTRVRLECPDLCPRYSARVIRGVRVGPSPAWLARRLATIGIAAINNVVDITNYVLMESGQPLHAFDLARLAGGEIIVRRARAGETIEAIDHKTYALSAAMCVIADARRPVAIGGVMGGAESEVSEHTSDLLIESAEFDPASIRATARQLGLHSPSSYRFERGLDPQGVEWASRRCCELILDLAGGELATGVIAVGRQPPQRDVVRLRYAQLKRVLGIDIPADEARRILVALGNRETSANALQVDVIPPSWRRDLEREIDLVEEVARIHGYEAIPEDVSVPMAPSARSDTDRVVDRIRRALTACGFDEALTVSAVEEEWSSAFSPWTDAEPLVSMTPVLRRADRLRRSLVPSLLGVRRTNEGLDNPVIELFETAKVYLPRAGQLPVEDRMIGLAGGGDLLDLKGAVETLVEAVTGGNELATAPLDNPPALFAPGRCCRLLLGGQTLGYLGEVSDQGLQRFGLRQPATVAELRFDPLLAAARLVPEYQPMPAYPAMTRDINLVVDESTPWGDVSATVRDTGGALVERLDYRDTYRDTAKLGAGKKSLLFTLVLRSPEGTLTHQEADALREAIVAACQQRHGAQLRA